MGETQRADRAFRHIGGDWSHRGSVRRLGPIKQSIGKFVVRLFRYELVGEPPSDPVCVMVAAPHTSNWDFVMAMAMAWSLGIDPIWLGKKEMFVGPFAPLFRAMGGEPVDRKNPAGLIDRLVAQTKGDRRRAILIPVEGTRSKGTHWKSGFRRIALGADIPVALSYLDKPTRTGGFGPSLKMTNDVVADMDQIRAFYADKHGFKPGTFTEPRLREESSVTDPA